MWRGTFSPFKHGGWRKIFDSNLVRIFAPQSQPFSILLSVSIVCVPLVWKYHYLHVLK